MIIHIIQFSRTYLSMFELIFTFSSSSRFFNFINCQNSEMTKDDPAEPQCLSHRTLKNCVSTEPAEYVGGKYGNYHKQCCHITSRHSYVLLDQAVFTYLITEEGN